MSRFGQRWLYTLRVKHLLADETVTNFDAHAVEIAPKFEAAVRELMKRVDKADGATAQAQGALYEELDEVADRFGEIKDLFEGDPDGACDEFNEVLGSLYDVCDYNKRVWVQ